MEQKDATLPFPLLISFSFVLHMGILAGIAVTVSPVPPKAIPLPSPLLVELDTSSPRSISPPAPIQSGSTPHFTARKARLHAAEPEKAPGNTAQLTASSVPALATSPQRTASTRTRYLDEVREALEKYKEYPWTARQLRQAGQVKVTFTILQDGSIKDLKVTDPSPYAQLDQSALDIFRKITRFSPLPLELGKRELRVSIPIRYQLN